MTNEKRPLKVFLCHASADKPKVRELYQRLKAENWIEPWLDEEKLTLGQHWTTTIEDALDEADVVIIFLSQNSVQKEGFVQRELNYAWELSLEKPIGTIFLIPFRLDDCVVPRHLRSRQWGDYFGEKKDETYRTLLKSLKIRYEQKLKVEAEEYAQQEQEYETSKRIAREKAEREAAEKAAREKADREVAEKAAHEYVERKDTGIEQVKTARPRNFYDLAQHYECEIPDSNAEIVAKNLLEELTRIKRIAEIPDSQNENHFTEYETNTVEYYDPKQDGTIQYGLVIEGKKSGLVGKKNTTQFNPRSVESQTVIPEMLIITVSQGINNASQIQFDSKKLPGDVFVQFVKGILLELDVTYVPGNIQKPPRKLKTEYIIAIISAAATILAALIGILSQIIKPASIPLARFTPTLTITIPFTPILTVTTPFTQAPIDTVTPVPPSNTPKPSPTLSVEDQLVQLVDNYYACNNSANPSRDSDYENCWNLLSDRPGEIQSNLNKNDTMTFWKKYKVAYLLYYCSKNSQKYVNMKYYLYDRNDLSKPIGQGDPNYLEYSFALDESGWRIKKGDASIKSVGSYCESQPRIEKLTLTP